ncbi:hypothetical protein T492DRAFT_1134110 [Pavlovales sp. CCMP2436]|nr:hypothetical protein T492DRAFT_1134110 [Pavlovales sp. CCMP2436]
MVLHGARERKGESPFLSSLRQESLLIANELWKDPRWEEVRGLRLKEGDMYTRARCPHVGVGVNRDMPICKYSFDSVRYEHLEEPLGVARKGANADIPVDERDRGGKRRQESSYALKAIPLSQLQDSIRLEVKWATQTNWGTYVDAASAISGCTISDIKLHISQVRLDGAVERAMIAGLGGVVHCPTMDYSHFWSTAAPNAGFISMQIPIRVSQACNIFIVLHESAVTNTFSRKLISQRTKASMIDYRFRVGATVIPQSAINCTGSAAEARFELARTFGSGVSDASARSCISAEQFLTDGYAVGLSLQAIPQTNALSDGISTQNMHVVFESKISASNPACYLDIWVQHEKMIVCQGGLHS